MKNQWAGLAALSAILIMSGCSASEVGMAEAATKDSVSTASESAAPSVAQPVNLSRNVIRNGSMKIRVDHVEKAEKRLSAMLWEDGGYVEASRSTGYGGSSPQATMELRVPANKFEQFIERISALGIVLEKELTSEDVTDQLIDVGARLKTLRAQEEKYRFLLSRASKLSDVHELESRLGDVRTEIEKIAAKQKVLVDQTSMSTLSVTLVQDAVATAAAASQGNWTGESWGQASSALVSVLKGLGALAIWLLMFAPIWGVIAVIAWFALRGRSKVVVSRVE
jgi:PBP1b-binding outer membrane lipoprotein LpoB